MHLFFRLLILSFFFVSPRLWGNGDPSAWIILNEDVQVDDIGGYHPLKQVVGDSSQVSWNSENLTVEGTGLNEKGIGVYPNDRFATIDFGEDHDDFHLLQTWTRYNSATTASGFAQLWWSDSLDTTLDAIDVAEMDLNFCRGGNVTQVGGWIQDWQTEVDGGITPVRRYLIIKHEAGSYLKSAGIAIVGYRGPVRIDLKPKIVISHNRVIENNHPQTEIGDLTIQSLEEGESYTIAFSDDSNFADSHSCFELDQENLKLFTNCTFDYEQQNKYDLKFKITDSSGGHTFRILSIQIENMDDDNGIASEAIAALHPQINPGDFVIWNPTSGDIIDYKNGGNLIEALGPDNKILIKGGEYSSIKLDLENIEGTLANRIEITNFLGQVFTNSFEIYNGSYWRLTGKYDASEQLGDIDFPGCVREESTEQFGFSNGLYGIWICREWTDFGGRINLKVDGFATGFEIDHLEISDGGFAGALIKTTQSGIPEQGPWPLYQDVHLHHLYIHDTGGEGIYLGETGAGRASLFSNLLIENVVCLRTGVEALQVGQLVGNCMVRNSVFWGALEWRDPFQPFQDNNSQFITRDGSNHFESNVMIGAGARFLHVQARTMPLPAPLTEPAGLVLAYSGTNTIANNLAWGCRHEGVYTNHSDGAYQLNYNWNYWGGRTFSYNELGAEFQNRNRLIEIRESYDAVTVSNNLVDASFDLNEIAWKFGSHETDLFLSENETQPIPPPSFINLLGKDNLVTSGNVSDDYLRWHRFARRIYEHTSGANPGNKDQVIQYQEGDIVQYGIEGFKTRFYRCKKGNSTGIVIPDPPAPDTSAENNEFWELLRWSDGETLQFCPPDDARLIEGSLYHQRGIGLGGDHESRTAFDSDNDGLPDSWEKRYGLNPNSSHGGDGSEGDLDGDGIKNRDEFLIWSKPNIPDSVPFFIQEQNIHWIPPRGRAWRLEYSRDLSTYHAIEEFAPGDGEQKNYPINTANGDDSLFYRLSIANESRLLTE